MNLSNNTILIIAGLFLWQVIGLASVTALAANHRWAIDIAFGLIRDGLNNE